MKESLIEPKTLIFIPTFNERRNVEEIVPKILALQLDADLLFVDDNSPDGTGELLDQWRERNGRIFVLHRPGKLGIGSAHIDGIAWAYEQGYDRLVTMDCDFSHSPADIPRLLQQSAAYDVVVGSRYASAESLKEWNLFRKLLTKLGHLLTRRLLSIEYDATGAFRVYNLRRIPKELFALVSSIGYSFFFESLFIIHNNQFTIGEIPIVLPARTYGHSKMSLREAAKSARRVASLFLLNSSNPARFRLAPSAVRLDDAAAASEWDSYWQAKKSSGGALYEFIAAVYRTAVIRRSLTAVIRRHFSRGSRLLHAGCGSGQVDQLIQQEMQITAVDLSAPALDLYRRYNPDAHEVRVADVFSLPWNGTLFDGVYNLGVVEHFTEDEIVRMLTECARVLRPGGRIVLFWPHRAGSSVLVLRLVHWFLNDVLKKQVQLHPPEITHVRSRSHARAIIERSGLQLLEYSFGPGDLFVQAVVVAGRPG